MIRSALSGYILPPLATIVSPEHYGQALIELARYAEAESVLRHAYDGLDRMAEPERKRQAVLTTLIGLYEAWGKPEKAAEYRVLLRARRRSRTRRIEASACGERSSCPH